MGQKPPGLKSIYDKFYIDGQEHHTATDTKRHDRQAIVIQGINSKVTREHVRLLRDLRGCRFPSIRTLAEPLVGLRGTDGNTYSACTWDTVLLKSLD